MRFDGQPAIALAITNQPGVNVVELGKRVDARLAELITDLPVGIEVHRVHWQSELIDAAVRGFFVSLAQAVLIVLASAVAGHGLAHGRHHRLEHHPDHPRHLRGDGRRGHRPAAHVARCDDHRARHDGRQLDRRRRRRAGAHAARHGSDEGRCRGGRHSRLGRCLAPRSSRSWRSIRSPPRPRTPASIAPRCSRLRPSRCC